MATVPDPSGVFVSGQAMSGVGWRVLLATRHGWTPTVPSGVSLPGTVFDNNWLDVADTVGVAGAAVGVPERRRRAVRLISTGRSWSRSASSPVPVRSADRCASTGVDVRCRGPRGSPTAGREQLRDPATRIGRRGLRLRRRGQPDRDRAGARPLLPPPSPFRLRLDGPGPYPVETEVTLSRRDTSAAGPPPSPAVTAASYPLSPPTAIQSWLATNTQIGFPAADREYVSARVSAEDAEQGRACRPGGSGYGFGTDHFTWTRIGCASSSAGSRRNPCPASDTSRPTYPLPTSCRCWHRPSRPTPARTSRSASRTCGPGRPAAPSTAPAAPRSSAPRAG